MLKKIDAAWLRIEKAVVVGGFLVMSVVVFADVAHRIAADRAWQTPLRLSLLALVSWGLGWAAVSTASKGRLSPGKAALQGLLVPVGLFGGSALFVWLMPGGVIWAQTLALVLTIWVGFVGASIATYEGKHLKVDAADRLFEGAAKRWVGAASNLAAAGFSGGLAVLAFNFCRYHYGIWQETQGAGGDFEGLPIPKHVAFSILPVALGTMTLRFLGQAVRRVSGGEPNPVGSAPSTPAAPTSTSEVNG